VTTLGRSVKVKVVEYDRELPARSVVHERTGALLTNDGLETALRSLAECVGEPLPDDVGDGHQRWALYRQAVSVKACHPQLLVALSLDPDDALVAGVVIRVMEENDELDCEPWINLMRSEKGRQYASRRAQEIEILRAHGNVPELSGEILSTWTDWLQVRLAEISKVRRPLELLAQYGRTKRIRRTAAQRLATM
jgi:hypothetical protein